MQRSPFDHKTAKELEQNEKTKADLATSLREAEELARKCISNENFIKYKDKFLRSQKDTIDALIDYQEPDPIKYAFNVRIMLGKLHQLRLLLSNVEIDAKPKVKK